MTASCVFFPDDEATATAQERKGLLPAAAMEAHRAPRGTPDRQLWQRRWQVLPVVGGGILLLGGLLDLWLSTTVAGRSGWGEALETWGETPGYAVVGAAALVLQLQLLGSNQFSRLWLFPVFLVLGLSIGLATDSVSHKGAKAKIDVCLVLSGHNCPYPAAVACFLVAAVVPIALHFFRASCGTEHTRAQFSALLWPCALHIVILFVVAGSAVEAIKMVWGRARPRMVLDGSEWPRSSHCEPIGPYDCAFSPWWAPQGYRAGLHSFPSGHTFCAWLSLPLPMHWAQLRSRNFATHDGETLTQVPIQETRVIWGVALCWGTLVMISRVAVGAHWLSDVGAGATITWGVALLLWDRIPSAVNSPTMHTGGEMKLAMSPKVDRLESMPPSRSNIYDDEVSDSDSS